MTGRMIDFDTSGSPATGYLATPAAGTAQASSSCTPGGGLPSRSARPPTASPRQASSRSPPTSITASRPRRSRRPKRWAARSIVNLTACAATSPVRCSSCAKTARPPRRTAARLALVGFSLGGAYASMSIRRAADEIAAVVTFYTSYTGLDYTRAKAAYLCHFAENDAFDPPEAVAEMEQEIKAAGTPGHLLHLPRHRALVRRVQPPRCLQRRRRRPRLGAHPRLPQRRTAPPPDTNLP